MNFKSETTKENCVLKGLKSNDILLPVRISTKRMRLTLENYVDLK
jgi:hypothetical protein